MIISIPKEQKTGETRVATTPEVVKKLVALGLVVKAEKAAGIASGIGDNEYLEAGAIIANSSAEAYEDADVVLKINAPEKEEYAFLRPKMVVIADFQARNKENELTEIAKSGVTCFALDLMPRISRAQSMDILSSQSNLAGYMAVIKAVNELPKAIPLMMTAAGTIPPAKVLILGVGVAGLQAIATAKRLGAQVFASDVRKEVKEQVESLGGKFLEVMAEENFQAEGGYAKETSADYQKRQKEAVTEQLKKTDIAITTALIPGKKAPRLIDLEMLKGMPKGSVVVDMATEAGGNVEGSVKDEVITVEGIKIIGVANLARAIPSSASALYARNIYNFLLPMYNQEKKIIDFDFADELIKATCIIKNGDVL